jgi:hypothetical protein
MRGLRPRLDVTDHVRSLKPIRNLYAHPLFNAAQKMMQAFRCPDIKVDSPGSSCR